jgi:hypothetical protein
VNQRIRHEIDTPSDVRSRRISAQSSTISTCFLPGSTLARVTGKLVNFQLPHRGQHSVAADKDGRGEFWFRLKASNGETVASGREL